MMPKILFSPAIILITIFATSFGDILDDIENGNEDIGGCLKIMGIDENKKKNYGPSEDLTKIYEKRKIALKNAPKIDNQKKLILEGKLDKAYERLVNLLMVRNINEQMAEDSVESNWNILDIFKNDRNNKGENEVDKKAKERKKLVEKWKNDGLLPNDGMDEAEMALEGIESAKIKMKNFLKLRNFGGINLSKMNVEALINLLDELEENEGGKLNAKNMKMDEILDEEKRKMKLIGRAMKLPKKIDEGVVKRAKEKLKKIIEKLKNYVKYRDLMEEKEMDDKIEWHLRISGGEENLLGKIDELTAEKIEKTKERRMAEFQRKDDFPSGIEIKRAIERIEKSAEKLENYLKIRPLLNSNEGKIDDLLKIMKIDIKRREIFNEEELRRAKEEMEKIGKKLPEGLEKTFKQIIDGAYEKLDNFLKIRRIFLGNEETLEENLAILGIELGKMKNYDENDIAEKINGNLPSENELPSDVKNIGQKMKNAEKRLRNYLLIRRINKWAKEDSVDSNLKILGLEGMNGRKEVEKGAEMMMEKIEEWKRGKELPEDTASMAKVEKAKEGIEKAKTKLTNYLKLRELEKAELANFGVEELVKLMDFDGQKKLDWNSMNEAKIKEERWRIQREFLWKKENFPNGLEEEMKNFEGNKLKEMMEMLRNYAKYRELTKIVGERVEDHLKIIGKENLGKERIKMAEIEMGIEEREKEFNGAKLPNNVNWAGIEEKIKESGKKLKNYVKYRNLMKKADENRVEDLMEVLGIERGLKWEMNEKMIKEGKEKKEAEFGNEKEFPIEEGINLKKAIEKIENSAIKLENYLLAREIGQPKDDGLKTHLAILGMEENDGEKIDEKAVKKRKELFEKVEQFPKDSYLERAKNQIDISLGKVKNYFLAKEKSSPKDDKLETNIKIIGLKDEELKEEIIGKKLEEWMKIFKNGREFPEDKDEERRNAKRQIESSAEKLKNFVKIRTLLEINGKKIVNLMEIIGINSERKEKFDEEELKKAKENLMKIGAKLPEGFEEKVKQKGEDAFKRLENYLKLREKYLSSKGNTLEDNLAILGIEKENYAKEDIQRAMAMKMPTADELPSDIVKLDEKMKKAAEKLENNLLVREINKIEAINLAEKWKILGILDLKRQQKMNENELKMEYKKRREKLKNVPNNVDEDLAIKKLEDAYTDLRTELERRKNEEIKNELEQKMRKENEENDKKRQKEEEIEEGKKREEANKRENERPNSEANCQDLSPFCHLSFLLCRNPYYIVSMQQNCKKSCGICVNSGIFSCEDSNPNCQNWDRSNDFCSNSIYSKGMKLEFCAKTCELCPN